MHQFYIQIGSQFLLGVVTIEGALTNPISLAVSVPLSVGAYFLTEDNTDDDEGDLNNAGSERVVLATPGRVGQEAATSAVGDVLESVIKLIIGKPESMEYFLINGWYYLKGIIMGNPVEQISGAIGIVVNKNAALKELMPTRFDIITFTVSVAISLIADSWENSEENKAITASRNANKEDEDNGDGISVLAITQ